MAKKKSKNEKHEEPFAVHRREIKVEPISEIAQKLNCNMNIPSGYKKKFSVLCKENFTKGNSAKLKAIFFHLSTYILSERDIFVQIKQGCYRSGNSQSQGKTDRVREFSIN